MPKLFTRALKLASAFGIVFVLVASPVFAQAPVLFGVDAKSISRARSLGLPVHYGSAWAGAWSQKWGWGGVEQEVRQAFAAGVTPVVHWWYWGDDISPTCVENGCADRYHGVHKDKATWTRLSTELAALIVRAGGPGAQAIVVLETEFNKNGIETYEPFDGYLAEQMAIFHGAGLKVVIGFGNWGSVHWDGFDRAIASADMLGVMALRSSLRDAVTYHTVADDLIASAQYLHTRFNKPTFVTDLAVSSYPAPEYETHQATVITDVFKRINELKTWGVIGIVLRMLADDPAFDINNYHGIAERHWGFVRADGRTKPAFEALRTGWLTEAAPVPPASRPSPFGQVDTPVQASTDVQGSVAMTGWALDAVGIASVDIYRECFPFDIAGSCVGIIGRSLVYVGRATIVPGARPDIEAAYADWPDAARAGWGFLMLTPMLPDVPGGRVFGGQGPLTIYAVATNVAGTRRLLGRSVDAGNPASEHPTFLTLANDSTTRPFGAIDTPDQGATVSGMLHNFGWVLTPDSNTVADATDILMPTDGSGVTVFIDGVAHGTVNFNFCRGSAGPTVAPGSYCDDDVASIFGHLTPQPVSTPRGGNPTRYRNLDEGRGAIGVFSIDTTTLSNGRHSLSWGVMDSSGRIEGVGSRFFWVDNR